MNLYLLTNLQKQATERYLFNSLTNYTVSRNKLHIHQVILFNQVWFSKYQFTVLSNPCSK
jgi:hypothetical protein